jgi:hypothetical protein
MQAMTNNYGGGWLRDQKSTINYHHGQQWRHWSLMGELVTKTRPGSTGTVHTMGGGGRLERIRGSREVRRHEVAERAAMLAAQSLADEWHCHKVTKCAVALVALVLAGEQCHHEVVEHDTMLVARALADKQRRHEAAKRTAVLAELVLAREQRNCQQQQQQW